MRQPIAVLADYLHLARGALRRRQPLVRDRALLLAGVIAAQIDLEPIAGGCRAKILTRNPRHLVRRWPTIGQALADEEFQVLINQLSTRYGPERVEQLVKQLGISDEINPTNFASEGEYAAALLDMSWDELVRRFGADFEE
jgi:hypothetical protein